MKIYDRVTPRYINSKNIPVLRAFFPNARIEELDAGHWGGYSLSIAVQRKKSEQSAPSACRKTNQVPQARRGLSEWTVKALIYLQRINRILVFDHTLHLSMLCIHHELRVDEP
jgi:hypothetical protein